MSNSSYFLSRQTANQADTNLEQQLQHVDASGKPQAWQHTLGDTEEFYQLIFNHINEAVLITDKTGAFLFISPNVERILGYSQSEVQGKFETITQLLGDNVLQGEDLETGQNNLNIEREITDKTGQHRTLQININQVTIGSDKLLYTCRDITPSKSVKPRRQRRGKKSAAQGRYAHPGVERNICEFHGVETALHPSTEFNQAQKKRDRQLAQEALRQSEEHYRRIIETTLEGVWMIDECSRTTLVNQKMASMLGYTIEEMMGKQLFEFIDEDAKAIAHQHIKQRRQGISEQYDFKFRCRDGSELWVIVSTTPLYSPEGQYVGALKMLTDITERKQAEEALREQEAILRSFYNSSPLMMGVVELLDDDILHLSDNQTTAQFFGTTPDAMRNQLASHLGAPPAHLQQWSKHYQESERTGTPVRFEYQHSTATQSRWLSATVCFIGKAANGRSRFSYVVEDITERKQSDDQLLWDKALLRSMTSASPLAFYVVDNRTDTILYFNHRFCEIWAIEHLEESMQRGELKNNDIIPACIPLLADVAAFAESCKPLQTEENRIVVEDEIPFVGGRTIRRFSAQIRDQGDRYFGRLYMFEDITERKQAEKALREITQREQEKALQLKLALQELQQTQAQLVQKEKMASLGQLVAGVAHEINNPTSFIYGNIHPAREYAQDLLHLVELYQQHYPNPVAEIAEQLEQIEPEFIAEDFPQLLDSMKEGAERIAQIVLSLRNFSRLDETELKPVNIHEGIDNTLLILRHRLKQQPHRLEIQVIKEYGQLPLIECYPGQMNQVFMNILSNAIDAIEESFVRGYLSLAKDNGQIRIRTEVVAGNRVAIRIIDNGLGIPADMQSQLFDPFFTTKPPGKGTGLGLSISYQIVVGRHKGKLSCDSAFTQGTEFAIELPIEPSGANDC